MPSMRPHRLRGSALVLLVGAVACGDVPSAGDGVAGGSESSSGAEVGGEIEIETETETDETEGGSTGAPGAPDACADACVELTTQIGIASCHACRCKEASQSSSHYYRFYGLSLLIAPTGQ